jgi:hypothetical protein
MRHEMLDRNDPQEIAPPKPTRLLNPICGVVRVFLYLALAFVMFPAVLFAVSPQAGLVGVLLGAILACSMLLAALITALVGLSISRRLKRFQKGEYLVHWTYSTVEWLEFAESEWERSKKAARQGPFIGMGIGGISGLAIGAASGYAIFKGVGTAVLGALAGGVLLALLGWLLGYLAGAAGRLVGWRRYQWMRQRDGVTYIGADAAYCEGLYWSWSMMNTRLVRVEFVAGSPNVLEFTVSVYMPKGGAALYHYRAPVPAGHEDEALGVVERLSRR